MTGLQIQLTVSGIGHLFVTLSYTAFKIFWSILEHGHPSVPG